MVAVLTILALVMAMVTLIGAGSAATGDGGGPPAVRMVRVHEGDTLWGIATSFAPPGQVRETVHRIQELNALPGPAIVEGQVLAVPVSSGGVSASH